MLMRASVSEVRGGSVQRGAAAHLVVAMRVYPRFLPRALTDEVLKSLSPPPELFQRYRELKKRGGQQNESFEQAGYEQLFELGEEGQADLARLAARASSEDVYLVCQCARSERCHVDLLLLLAEAKHGTRIGALPFSYAEFRQRIVAPGCRPERG